MSLMLMKVFYKKQKPKVIQYIKYNHFSKKAFMHELEGTFSSFSQISLGTFKKNYGQRTSIKGMLL